MTAEVDLFVYGTLMDENILYSLTGRSFSKQPAELPGFERIFPLSGYPYIIPNPDSRTSGLLIYAVDQSSLARLDQYEEAGLLYDRRRVEVLTNDGLVPCDTYVGNVEALSRRFANTTPGRNAQS